MPRLSSTDDAPVPATGSRIGSDPVVRSVLAEARQCYVAVASRGGPHVTPALYAVADDLLWFFAAANTLKARALNRDPRVGVLVRARSRTVVLSGTVQVTDPADVVTVAAALADAPRRLGAVASFAMRNASDLVGFAGDLAAGRTGGRHGLPPRRLLFAVHPDRVAVLDDAGLTRAWGDWPQAPAPGPRAGGPGCQEWGRPPVETAAGPDPCPAAFPAGDDAVLGWETAFGPLAVPGRWDGDERRGWLSGDLLAAASAPAHSRACVVRDDYGAPGPAAKSGTLLRGRATALPARGAARVTFATQRVTEWRGVRTETRQPA